LIEVHDLDSAKLAITEIIEQGEGATIPRPPLPGEEAFGGYEHYGIRLDGTFGPILGTPWELSHYNKFKQLADGEVPAPATYPMQPDPSTGKLDGELRQLSGLFDGSFTLVLRALERAFTSPELPVNFFAVAFPVMRLVLPSLAVLLMRTTLESQADPELGPTAGPSFAYHPVPLADLIAQAEYLLAHPLERDQAYQGLWRESLGLTCRVLREAREASESGGPMVMHTL
jgi:hypothetical protein